MLSRRLLALLLGPDEIGDALSGLNDELPGPIVHRALAAGFVSIAGEDTAAAFRRTLDEYILTEPTHYMADQSALCRILYDRFRTTKQASGMSFGLFEEAFGRFVIVLRESFAQATEPQLVDMPCRELGNLSLDELSRMQAPDELFNYISGLAAHFLDRQAISPADAEYMTGLVEKMVSAPGYLRFLGEEKKREETARLMRLLVTLRLSDARPSAALNDFIVVLGLLMYHISPTEKAAAGLASVRPSSACPELQYHYSAIMALGYVLTGKLDLAARHAGLAGRSTGDPVMQAYISILQGCIALGQGDPGRAAGLLETAGAGAPGGRMKALALFYRGLVLIEQRDYEGALGCFLEAGDHVTDPLDRATVHNNIGTCAAYLGDLTLAETSFAAMEKLADSMGGDGALRCRLVAGSHFGALMRMKGDHSGAIGRFQQALQLALRSGDGQAVANQMGNLGTAYARAGDADAALQLLNACMAYSERRSYWPGIRYSYWHICRVLTKKGNGPEARKFRETYTARYPELKDLH